MTTTLSFEENILSRDRKMDEIMSPVPQHSLSLFQQLIEDSTPAEIATTLGLHPNTVKRWLEFESVPSHYISDFQRMLNGQGNSDDQFFTKPRVAKKCFHIARQIFVKLGIDVSSCHFIEPSAGCGFFYDILPKKRRTGIDIHPRVGGLIESDYLLWRPKRRKSYVVIGNPPFGLRGHLALQFINHSADFADAVAFILPQLFESDGKGVPAKRVDSRLKLAFSEPLPSDSFVRPDGTDIDISTIFQIWTARGHDKITLPPRKTASSFIKIYSLSDGGTPSSTRNRKMIGKCDVYLPSTCFKGMQAYQCFHDLPNKRGYGIVIHKNKREIKRLLMNQDWTQIAFTSTNGAVNLRSSLIEGVITAGGYCDE